MPKAYPNYIGIDANSPFSLPFVLGHELGHAVEKQQKGLYEHFKSKVMELVSDPDGYIAKEGLTRFYSGTKLTDEVFNDTLGFFFRDPQMWNELAKKDLGLVKKTGRIFVILIDKMLRGLRARTQRDVAAHVEENLSAIRAHVVDLLKQYREAGDFTAFTPEPRNPAPPIVWPDDGLLAAPLIDAQTAANTKQLTEAGRKTMASPDIEQEARAQQEAFQPEGKVIGRADLANISADEAVRGKMDLVDEMRKEWPPGFPSARMSVPSQSLLQRSFRRITMPSRFTDNPWNPRSKTARSSS